MQEQSGPRRFADGVERFVHIWSPSSSPLAVIGFVHGLGEHSGRYREVAAFFAEQQIASVALDQLGHGKSTGARGCIESYDSMLDEVQRTLSLAQETWPSLPVVLYGHSMGGNLVANYSLRRTMPLPVANIISAPMFRASRPPSKAFIRFARTLAKFFPHLVIKAPVEAKLLTRDPLEQQRFLADPLLYQRLSLRLGAALLDSGQWAIDHAHKLKIPTKLIHGTYDEITSADASREFQKNSNRTELQLWPDMRHELHFDIGREKVLQNIYEWLAGQIL